MLSAANSTLGTLDNLLQLRLLIHAISVSSNFLRLALILRASPGRERSLQGEAEGPGVRASEEEGLTFFWLLRRASAELGRGALSLFRQQKDHRRTRSVTPRSIPLEEPP